ncbi:YbaK/EbsC family protein [Aquabacterium sp. J223]|uniref:YbaK/EbsC family protein n=1 Tax=Aquabacterium sp. J223 TaxID=2898431 RepID=UPI0021ADE3EF|nr:YbaK/EbsC family protein [Aquabacterium sp. J223]UUX95827.1 YbaK/EbsC family protein [Aquabacterium sp. J223]
MTSPPPLPTATPTDTATERPEGFRRVEQALAQAGHAERPRWLAQSARTAAEAAEALGVTVGQIAKCVVFRRLADDAAVMVVASGDRRVDEAALASVVGPVGRADAAFVRAATGFVIGGVSPVGEVAGRTLVKLMEQGLFRFDVVWAAAGHANGVFPATPAQLQSLTGAPVHPLAQG